MLGAGHDRRKRRRFIEEALFSTMTNVNFDLGTMLELCLECGRKNLRVMEMLDHGHVRRLGAPRRQRLPRELRPDRG